MDSLKGKFSSDVVWNIASLVVLGLAGIVINIAIARLVGADALGVFNQVFAVYIFLSQICVGGVHFSVLKEISYAQDDLEKCSTVTSSALVLSALISLVICAIALLFSNQLALVLDSPDVGKGMFCAIPGLLFFSLNKNLLNVLNGLQWMRAFAIFQALRFVGILLAILGIIFLGNEAWMLPLSLTISEVVLFITLGLFVNTQVIKFSPFKASKEWIRTHFSFGMRGFLSGVFTEINTRVDVLMLGLFLGDAKVGIYSFAAILAEGFSQIPFVLRKMSIQ
ncbi:MAG: oligosaccharide flippase family protein [Bdellovibrionota bacterium]